VPPELKTVGYYDFEGQLKIGITAHPKIDADTQELVFFSYNPSKPFIHHGVVDKEGKLSSLAQVQIPRSVMMHDFAITKNYSILMDFPFYFDTKAILKKEAILTFDPSINARFGVLPRHSVDGNDIKWFQAPKTGFVYHTLGAYEEGDCIYLFACKYDRMELKPTETIPPYLIKWTFNLQTGSCDEEQLFDLPFEWPRINEAYTGIKFNYGYVLTQRPFLPKEKKPFNVICKVDVQQRTVTECPFGLGKDGGEFVFVPRPSCKSEDDGYLVGYVYDNSREISEFMIIDAIQMKILTIMELPQRVPNGFHGIFLTKQQLNQM
jgi:carotenoid cleavage dioxygenase